MRRTGFYVRWALLLGSGAIVFQTTASCADILQTGFLAFIAGATYFLARNV
ncbi:MAG: hypothetical protein HY718_00315 [Planctomycetes bacterium]|nr:hypothetical protein [Planctomycetota bacterium]